MLELLPPNLMPEYLAAVEPMTIERVCAEVGRLPKQDWSLRVTQVFRRAVDKWQLVHRQADPLANGIGLQQAAALALGVADDFHAAQ